MTQVRVEQGIVGGNQKDGVFRFRGMPYAAPPVGERRWAAPQTPAAWECVLGDRFAVSLTRVADHLIARWPHN